MFFKIMFSENVILRQVHAVSAADDVRSEHDGHGPEPHAAGRHSKFQPFDFTRKM